MTVYQATVAALGILFLGVFGIVLFAYAIGLAAKRADEATEHAWNNDDDGLSPYPTYRGTRRHMRPGDPVIGVHQRRSLAGRVHHIEDTPGGWRIHITGPSEDGGHLVTESFHPRQVQWATTVEGADR